jgi:Fic family protein
MDNGMTSNRAGRFILQPGGYKTFVPNSLPPEPEIMMDSEMIKLLSLAENAMGRLDYLLPVLPDAQMFIKSAHGLFVKVEATQSSQIEGTQASFIDELDLEAGVVKGKASDADEIKNYVNALEYGLERLGTLPLSLRLIREIHEKLLAGVRGHNRTPGQFRTIQNYIAPLGVPMERATYIPPPVPEMKAALDNFEKFIHQEYQMSLLIKCGVLHAQFEMIHPFLDGNGRVGRLLITLFLCERKVLSEPILYLSKYFNNNRRMYYDLLGKIHRQGDWESWIKFFLNGVIVIAADAREKIEKLLVMKQKHRQLIIAKSGGRSKQGQVLHEKLFKEPVVDAEKVCSMLGVSVPTANDLLKDFIEMGILAEQTGKKRNRIYMYKDYVQMFMD